MAVPKGGGALRGQSESFRAGGFSGALEMAVPLRVSGARGLEPELELDYGSSGGNGPFGLGFELSLPVVSRNSEQGIPRYDSSDGYVLTGSGPLVPSTEPVSSSDPQLTGRRFRPRLEEDFARIEQWTHADGASFWKTVSRDNVTHWYGRSAGSRIADSAEPTRIYQWLLDETADALGNRIVYRYRPEDLTGVSPEIFEQGRSSTANRYLQSIHWGNYRATTGEERFGFTVELDYGGIDLDRPLDPPGPWTVRADPFSSYRAGFEIRTYRLCRAFLQYHQFEGQLDDQRVLVSATALTYDEDPARSLLRGVQEIGFRQEAGQPLERKALPSLELAYSPFQPERQHFTPLRVAGDAPIPGPLAGAYELIDLYGEGIPGVLYRGEQTALYFEPAGGGAYLAPEVPAAFPLEPGGTGANGPRLSLTDLDGDGRQELVVQGATSGGFYRCRTDRSWTPFQPFASYPLELSSPAAQLVDLNGNGRADLLLQSGSTLRYYPSSGTAGFQAPVARACPPGFPGAEGSAQAWVGFTDVFGDGLAHKVRVTDGSVEAWPDLGRGVFGPPVRLGNAPRFSGGLDAGRLFLVDLSGDGPVDLVHVEPDRIAVYLNESGNRFRDPLYLPLPAPYDDLASITFGDVTGSGAPSLVFTRLDPAPVHWSVDLTGGTRPHLLLELDNGVGGVTRARYRSSVQEYLEDKRAGRPWVTRVPFPVQVVSSLETVDQLAGSREVATYRYHEGYYDPVARAFRGFGFVERWDARLEGADALDTPPVHTKTWFETGAYEENAAISAQYAREFFHGDPEAFLLPESTLDATLDRSDGETVRQARDALHGRMLREEVYGLDGDPALAANPYTVTQNNYHARLVQPRGTDGYAVFHVYEQQTVDSDYERNPADPRVAHDFTLDVDDFGDVRKSATVHYPRRQPASQVVSANPAENVQPEQLALLGTVSVDDPIDVTDPFYLLGLPGVERELELGGLTLPASGHFSLEEIRGQVDEALANPIRYGQPFTPGKREARLLSWEQYIYWDEAQVAPLPPGKVTAQALLHHKAQAVAPPELIASVFGERVDAPMLEAGGYFLADGYWWTEGDVYVFYKGTETYYRPKGIANALGGWTEVTYDAYWLAPVEEREYLSDTVFNTSTARIDYRVVQPWQVVDPNRNTSQVLFDALGMVEVSTLFGETAGAREGDDPLDQYARRLGATFDAVLADPHHYLQGAADYFFYDLNAWRDRGQPPSSIQLVRQEMVSALPPRTPPPVVTTIKYSDGSGRLLETKLKTTPGPAILRDAGLRLARDDAGRPVTAVVDERWVVSGRTVYDNKGAPVREYLPYFSNTPYYEDQAVITDEGLVPPPYVYHHDPLGRVIRTDTPKGFFTRTVYQGWVQTHYDEDDTVTESTYYRDHIHDTSPPFADELDALKKAARFADTPSSQVLDTLGRAFLDVQMNLSEGGEQIFLPTRTVLDIEGNPLSQSDPRLGALDPPVANLVQVFNMAGEPLSWTSVDAGQRLFLSDAFGHPIHTWDSRGFHVATTYDAFQRKVDVTVERGGDPATLRLVEHVEYGEFQADPDRANLRGQAYRVLDEAGLLQNKLFDIRGLLLDMERQLTVDYQAPVNWRLPPPLEPEAHRTRYAYNALGNITAATAPDGSTVRTEYSADGLVRRVAASFVDPVPAEQSFVEGVEYNASAEREEVRYGNGVVTRFTNEWTTRRLLAVRSERPEATRPSGEPDGRVVQDVGYTYDPAGNVTRSRNRTPRTVFCDQAGAPDLGDYRYDAVYQLLEATGLQHPGIGPETHVTGFKQSLFAPLCPTSGGVALQEYVERYAYDAGGNLTSLQHVSTTGPEWGRTVDIAPASNRGFPADSPDTRYDENGNLTAIGNLRGLRWGFRNTLSQVDLVLREGGAAPDSDYCTYDASGRRIRKVVERYPEGAPAQIRETVYLGELLLYREREVSGGPFRTTRRALHVGDDHGLVAISALATADPGARTTRYQLHELLGSATVEVNEAANLLSYECFLPYGGTSAIAGPSEPTVQPKDFRYSGQECDDSTGLYDYGARYYLSWLGRWASPDPGGTIDGLNLYAFVGGNPLSHADVGGFAKHKYRRRKVVGASKYLHTLKRRHLPALGPKQSWSRKSGKWRIRSKRKLTGLELQAYGSIAVPGGLVFNLGRLKTAYWRPQSTNTGKGISRKYPITNPHYRAPYAPGQSPLIRTAKSMFKAVPKGQIGFVRGHLIPHADTIKVTPLSNGLLSTEHAFNYYPEPEGWGEKQRKHREQRARERGTPIKQVNVYDPKPLVTNNGTPIPTEIYFIEFTGKATDTTYSASKSYDKKVYHLVYAGFDYDSLAPATPGSDRKSLKTLRIPDSKLSKKKYRFLFNT